MEFTCTSIKCTAKVAPFTDNCLNCERGSVISSRYYFILYKDIYLSFWLWFRQAIITRGRKHGECEILREKGWTERKRYIFLSFLLLLLFTFGGYLRLSICLLLPNNIDNKNRPKHRIAGGLKLKILCCLLVLVLMWFVIKNIILVKFTKFLKIQYEVYHHSILDSSANDQKETEAKPKAADTPTVKPRETGASLSKALGTIDIAKQGTGDEGAGAVGGRNFTFPYSGNGHSFFYNE